MWKPSIFPAGFANGLIVRNMPILQAQPGQIFWVGNSTNFAKGCVGGADGNPGTYQRPLATLQVALNKCNTNGGDIVMVKAGHAETITTTAQLALNKAGVAIIGLGVGANRPTLTFATNTTANIPVTAANVSIQNFLFVANVAAVVSVFTVTGTATPTDFEIANCEFRDGASNLNFISLLTGNATSLSLSGLRFVNNRISSLGTTAATTAIKALATTDRVQILGNYGNWAVLNDTAAMFAGSTFAHTNFQFGWNILNRPNTSSTGGSFISGSSTAWTGHCHDNYLYQLDGTTGIWVPTGTKLAFSQNFSPITGAADASGLINPAAA